jgi:hypothetical protein
MKNTTKFAVVFFVVNLHLLRNVATIPYLAAYAAVSGAVLVSFCLDPRTRQMRLGLPLIWLVVALAGTAVSLLVIPWSAALYGASRFLFVTPIFLAFVQYTASRRELVSHVRCMTLFFVVAALTIPLQIATGPVSWFAEDSERGGYDRFGSLVGSLTSLGIVTGCYIVLMQLSSPRHRFVQIAVTILSALVSLSKAAIANVGLSLLASLWVNRDRLSRGIAALVMLGAFTAVAVAYIPPVNDRLESTLESFGFVGGAALPANYDSSVQKSAIDRVSALPRANFLALGDQHSPLVYFVGGGFGMASTALVTPEASTAPMAHNQYAELVTVFGILGGGFMVWVLVAIGVRLKRRARAPGDIPTVVLASYTVLLVNSLFANGTVYQPASASILCLAAYVAGAPHRHLFTDPDGEEDGRPLRTRSRAHVSR